MGRGVMAWIKVNARDLDTLIDVYRVEQVVNAETRTVSAIRRKVGSYWAGIKQQSMRDVEVAAAIRSAEELKVRLRVVCDVRAHDIVIPASGPHKGEEFKVVRVNPLDRQWKDCHAKRENG